MTVETVVYTQPVGGGVPVEEFPAEIIRYSYRLNRPGNITFTLPLDHPKTVKANIEPGVHEVVVRRNGADVWRGPLLPVDETDARTSRTLTCRGEGLMGYLRKWHVTSTLTYTAATHDQTTAIAWGLIDHHQAKSGGSVGITNGTVATGRKRDRTYLAAERKNIFDAIVELSELNDGFDFDFDPATRAFKTFYPKRGQRRNDVVFDDRNIRTFQRTIDPTGQASQVHSIGAGEGVDTLIATAQSSTAVARYGLTQEILTAKDVSVAQTLTDHATQRLARRAVPPNLIRITAGTADPPLFSYGLGDEVRVKWDSPYDPIDEYQRLTGFDVTWQAGEEQATLLLEPLS